MGEKSAANIKSIKRTYIGHYYITDAITCHIHSQTHSVCLQQHNIITFTQLYKHRHKSTPHKHLKCYHNIGRYQTKWIFFKIDEA